jgi:hypothetical protein
MAWDALPEANGFLGRDRAKFALLVATPNFVRRRWSFHNSIRANAGT